MYVYVQLILWIFYSVKNLCFAAMVRLVGRSHGHNDMAMTAVEQKGEVCGWVWGRRGRFGRGVLVNGKLNQNKNRKMWANYVAVMAQLCISWTHLKLLRLSSFCQFCYCYCCCCGAASHGAILLRILLLFNLVPPCPILSVHLIYNVLEHTVL